MKSRKLYAGFSSMFHARAPLGQGGAKTSWMCKLLPVLVGDVRMRSGDGLSNRKKLDTLVKNVGNTCSSDTSPVLPSL